MLPLHLQNITMYFKKIYSSKAKILQLSCELEPSLHHPWKVGIIVNGPQLLKCSTVINLGKITVEEIALESILF